MADQITPRRWLLVDDIRDLGCDVTCRTPEEARAAIQAGGFTDMVFDHDLAAQETGYDILTWAAENDLLAPHVQLCTSNPVGRARMIQVLEAHGYQVNPGNPYDFHKAF